MQKLVLFVLKIKEAPSLKNTYEFSEISDPLRSNRPASTKPSNQFEFSLASNRHAICNDYYELWASMRRFYIKSRFSTDRNDLQYSRYIFTASVIFRFDDITLVALI